MSKLRQLQSSRITYRSLPSIPAHKGRSISRKARITVAALLILITGTLTYAVLHWPNQKKQDTNNTNRTLVNVPGGEFLPSLQAPINILVMGVDSNGQNTERFIGTRSDSMILLSLDPQKQKVGIISIPRDSRVQIANSHNIDKINAAHAFGGPQLAVTTVSQCLNIPIDKYLVVDVQGTKRILEALGSVDVLVEKKMNYVDHTAKLCVNLEPGLQTLNAQQAEQYLRYRHDAKGDIGRIERQQWFARQLLPKLTQPETLVKLPALLSIVQECVITNLSVDEMVRLFGFACHIDPKQIEMATLPGIPATIGGISYWVLDPAACTATCNKLVSYHPSSDTSLNPAPISVSQDSAIAYASVPDRSIAALPDINSSPPPISEDTHWSAIIRYPKSLEQQAAIDEQVAALESKLKEAGFVFKGKYRSDLADCQHEQIIESSAHALSFDLNDLRDKLPNLSKWPSVINVDSQNGADFIFVVTPNSKFSV